MGQYVIAGGGVSGLAAGFRLQQAGHQVRILESADRAGSKMCSESRDGFVLDRAAIFVTTGYDRLLALADDAGSAEDIVPGGSLFGFGRSGDIHEIDGDHPIQALARTRYLTPREKLQAATALAPEVWRCRTSGRDRIADLGKYDTTTVAQWAQRRMAKRLGEATVGALLRSTYGAEPESLSRAELLGVLALLSSGSLLGFRGGLQTHVDRVAATLDITLGATVLEVLQRPGFAEVTWRDRNGGEHTEHCDGCVVALPAQVAAQVRTDLDPWRREWLAAVRQGPLLTVSVALDRTPPDVQTTYTMLARSEHPALVAIVCDHNKAAGRALLGKGLLTLVLNTEWSAPHFDDDDQSIAQYAIAAAEPYLPGTADHVEFVRVSRWHQQYPRVGHYAALGDMNLVAAKLDRSVHLCGEYLYSPNLNAATASGEDAARAVLAAAPARVAQRR